MTRLSDLLDPAQRALCEKLSRHWERPPQGQRFTDVLGFLLVPLLVSSAWMQAGRPPWGAFGLGVLGGVLLGVLPTRLLANRRERLVALLYGELSERERQQSASSRQA